MLSQIVMTMCLLQHPEVCREFNAMVEYNGTPYQCQAYGTLKAQEWVESHPGYFVKRWKCLPKGKLEAAL